MAAHTSGPVPIQSDSYIERNFELQVFRHLSRKEWVVLLGPRQHGKTSALLRIMAKLKKSGFLVAFIDLQSQPPFDAFEDFLGWISHSIWYQLGGKKEPRKPVNWSRPSTWWPTGGEGGLQAPAQGGNLIDWLNSAIAPGTPPIAILIDEAANISNDAWRNSFYGQIRAIANERAQAEPGDIASRIAFLFSGTFRVESLVDTVNSPFNVCKEIKPQNLSADEVHGLCKLVLESEEHPLATQIWDYVGGQPFLVQSLLAEIESVPEEVALEKLVFAITKLNEGTPHIASILSKVVEDPKLINIVSDVIKHGAVQLAPADNDMKFLQVLGLLIMEDKKLIFANQYYLHMATASPQLTAGAPSDEHPRRVLYEVSEEYFNDIGSAELREIVYRAHRGAISAYNNGSFRLSLTGFGIAFEGVLIDWLSNTPAPDLATAISKAKPKFDKRFHDSKDPKTWSLSILVNVGRKLAGKSLVSEADIPNQIKDWRNYVHPKVMLDNYEPEEDMEVYAFTAEGLFRSALHIIGKA